MAITYDALGRRTRESDSFGGGSATRTYEYLPNGQLEPHDRPQAYTFDSSCSSEQQLAINQALAQAVEAISTCFNGACGDAMSGGQRAGSNLRRNWVNSLFMGTYHCDAGPGQVFTTDGFIYGPTTRGVMEYYGVTKGLSVRDTTIAPIMFDANFSGNGFCFAGLLAHEALHPVLYFLDMYNKHTLSDDPLQDPDGDEPFYIDNTAFARSIQAHGLSSPGHKGLVEDYIDQNVKDCNVCGK